MEEFLQVGAIANTHGIAGEVKVQGSSSKSAESSNNDSYTVKILAPGDASTDDCAKISEAASKITEEKFNTKIEVTRVGFGSYDQQRFSNREPTTN